MAPTVSGAMVKIRALLVADFEGGPNFWAYCRTMANEIDIVTQGLQAAIKYLQDGEKRSRDVMTRIHKRIGFLIKDTSADYAPISPTQGLLDLAIPSRKKRKRKATATSRPKPGGLVRSIEFKSSNKWADVYVAAGSEAGRYAFIIHEMKGITWKNRGLGTKAKGPKADDEFIKRAIDDKEPQMVAIIADEQIKALKI